MIELKDVRDYIKTAQIASNYYIGKLDSKKEKSVGVYQLNAQNAFDRAVGEEANDRVHRKAISVLVHWTKNAAETETAARQVYEFIKNTAPGTTLSTHVVNYIQMIHNEPIDVSTDSEGIYERVIEFVIHYN